VSQKSISLTMAGSGVQHAARIVDPEAGGSLRDIGRDYLTKATKVTSVLGPSGLRPSWARFVQSRVRHQPIFSQFARAPPVGHHDWPLIFGQ
jgi:hypothetical protein